MSEYAQNFTETGVTPVYNAGVVRVPQGPRKGADKNIGYIPQLFADLLPNKDVVGGQVAEGFVGDVGQPLKNGVQPGTYVAVTDLVVDAANVVGLLLLATDAFDGPRFINVVKGGTVFANIGALANFDSAALASALGGDYDPIHETIKF